MYNDNKGLFYSILFYFRRFAFDSLCIIQYTRLINLREATGTEPAESIMAFIYWQNATFSLMESLIKLLHDSVMSRPPLMQD